MDYVYLIICNLFSLSLWNVISKPLSCIQCVTLFIIKQCVNVNIHFRGAKFLEYCYCLSLEHFNVLVTILFFPRKLLAHILTLICFFPKLFKCHHGEWTKSVEVEQINVVLGNKLKEKHYITTTYEIWFQS